MNKKELKIKLLTKTHTNYKHEEATEYTITYNNKEYYLIMVSNHKGSRTYIYNEGFEEITYTETGRYLKELFYTKLKDFEVGTIK